MLSIILTGAALIREREHGTIEHLLVTRQWLDDFVYGRNNVSFDTPENDEFHIPPDIRRSITSESAEASACASCNIEASICAALRWA